MPCKSVHAVVVAVGLALLALAGRYAPVAAVPAPDEPAPVFGKDLVVYLGCGEVQGPGTVVQLDSAGNVLGTVGLSNTPYGLAALRDAVVAAVPSAGNVVSIDRRGRVRTLLQDPTLIPHPINVAADPATGDLLVADNSTDNLLHVPAGRPKLARTVLQIQGFQNQFQDMSVAFARDGALLFGGSGPDGIYRFRAGKDATLGRPLLPDRGAVAADPTSKRWVAALKDDLRVFEGEDEVFKVPYPQGLGKWHDTAAFGADGTLVLALHAGGTNYEIYRMLPNGQALRPLFAWNKSRIVCLTVGPKMDWGK